MADSKKAVGQSEAAGRISSRLNPWLVSTLTINPSIADLPSGSSCVRNGRPFQAHLAGDKSPRRGVNPSCYTEANHANLLMKFLSAFLFICSVLPAQTPSAPGLPDLPDETVIAVFDDGAKMTMGEYRKIYAALPSNQQGMVSDRKAFLEQYGLMRKLARMAEEQKLDQTSPTKESLAFYRLFILSQAKMNDAVMNQLVEADEIGKYYAANKDRYKEVKTKAIYITFSRAQASQSKEGKPVLTEEEAKAKAAKLVASIRGGADFVKLVHENSEDATSRDKDGDFATFKGTERDKIPAPVAAAVFGLKQGEVSDPIEQANGFYIFRADQVTYRTEAELRSEIFETLRQLHFQDWMQRTHDSVKVEFPNAAFLGGAAPAPAK